ncbi:MAG: NTP transferase domain-containing protein [Elusimicrobia bacterium]|nr:NTP transferase domain-containing protein [Elusimicrobiota bacterium]
MRPISNGERWAIILAGGEGTRMTEFAINRFGEARPKQYCSFMGENSMLEHTLRRGARIVGRQRLVTVIGKGHVRFLRRELPNMSGFIVEQPRNVGTAPGVFLPLTYVMAHDPDATVLILPSDHYIAPNDRFVSLMTEAAALAELQERRLVLGAAVADRPETEYGWIETGDPIEEHPDAARVLQFHEKPDQVSAERFYRSGFLWNTLNMAVKANTLWRIGWELLPGALGLFERLRSAIGTPSEGMVLERIYGEMGEANFSKEILERAMAQTLALSMRNLEWSDWGRPERVEEVIGRRLVQSLV